MYKDEKCNPKGWIRDDGADYLARKTISDLDSQTGSVLRMYGHVWGNRFYILVLVGNTEAEVYSR